MRTLKRSVKPRFLVWLLLLALVAWVLHDIPLQEVWGTINGLNPGKISVLIILNVGIVVLLSSRWWLILRALGYSLPYLTLMGYRQAAFGVSYFTPGPQFGGEPLQVYLTRNRHSVPGASAVAAVTLDKLLELIANFSFLAYGIFVTLQGKTFGDSLGSEASFIALGLLSAPVIYLISLWSGRSPLTWFADHILVRYAMLPSVRRFQQVSSAAEEQARLFCRNRPLALFLTMLLSLSIWIALVAEYWLALQFLGARLNLPQTIGVLTLARLAFLSPTPGGLGTLEASQILAMGALGLSPAFGLSMSLLIRSRDVIFGGLGLLFVMYLSRQVGAKPQVIRPEI